MEKHTSKRRIFAGMLALSAGLILAGCDPISAVPLRYNESLVKLNDGTAIDLDGNNIGTIYDEISSDRNAKVVEKLLKKVAEEKFGTYADFLEACGSTDKENAYISAHADFFGSDENKNTRFANFKADINARISEAFYNEITSGSYNDELGRFDESKLIRAHKYELYDLKDVTPKAPFFVDNTLTKENASNFITLEVYQEVTKKDEETKRGYIQEKIYPDILRNKLVEDYVFTENESSLGRAYARQLKYVKISYDKDNTFAQLIMENFGKNQIQTTATSEVDYEIVANAAKGFLPSTMSSTNSDLIKPIITSVKTFAENGEAAGRLYLTGDVNADDQLDANDLVEDNFWTVEDSADYKFISSGKTINLIPAGKYHKKSKVGAIIEEYRKALRAEAAGRFPTTTDKAALDSFTGDGKTKQYGLLQKLLSLMKEDYTTSGWYVKNDGVTELPSAIRDRLFNIRVSIALDDETELFAENAEFWAKLEAGDLSDYNAFYKNKRTPYLRNVYGKKLVLTDALALRDYDQNYIYEDRDGSAFYICEVTEAPSTAKLRSDEYKTAIEREEIKRQVAKVLGTKDSYIKDAYTVELNKLLKVNKVDFYDTSLYDYLKGEYPDLDIFDED